MIPAPSVRPLPAPARVLPVSLPDPDHHQHVTGPGRACRCPHCHPDTWETAA